MSAVSGSACFSSEPGLESQDLDYDRARLHRAETLDAETGLTLEVWRLKVRGRPHQTRSDPPFMSVRDAEFHRVGRPPEMVTLPQTDGSIRICWNDFQSMSVRVTHLSEDRRVLSDHMLLGECRLAVRAADDRHKPQGVTRILGGVETPSGSVVVTRSSVGWDGGAWLGDMVSRPIVHAHLVREEPNACKSAELSFNDLSDGDSAPSRLWRSAAPMAMSTARLAYGGGRICLHYGQLMRWIDGDTAQVGLAKTWSMSDLLESRSKPMTPHQGSKLELIGSRSLDQRVAFDRARGVFVLAALSDSFPRGILTGRLWDDVTHLRVLHKCLGQPGGSDPLAELGGLISRRHSDVVSYCSANGSEPEARDHFLAIAPKDSGGTTTTTRVTKYPPGTYATCPKLVSSQQDFMLFWKEERPSRRQSKACVVVVNGHGQVASKVISSPAIEFHRADDFFSDRDGNVNWVTGNDDGLYWHRITRRAAHRAATDE